MMSIKLEGFFLTPTRLVPALKKYFPHLEIFIKKLDDARVQIICENRHSIILALHHQSASPLAKKIIWDDGSNNNRYDNGKILIIILQLPLL